MSTNTADEHSKTLNFVTHSLTHALRIELVDTSENNAISTASVAVGRDTTSANTANQQVIRANSADGCVSSVVNCETRRSERVFLEEIHW
jgi:hypothetical protein